MEMFQRAITIFFCLMAVMPVLAEGGTIQLKEVVVSATRYAEELSSVPAHVSIITDKEIQSSTAKNIPDILRNEVGIQVNDIAGNQRNMTVDIRGFGETSGLNTLVLVDGRRVNQADLSGTDWTQIPLDRVERIEIIRGGRGGVLFGDNASGGVINIITKEGYTSKIGKSFAAGSFETYKGDAYIFGTANNISYSLNVNYLSSEGYRDNADTGSKDLGLNVNYFLNDLLKLNISSGYHNDKTGLPGALRESDFAAGASRTDTVHPDDFAKVKDFYVKGGPELYFLDDSLAKVDLSFRKRKFLSFASFVGGEFTGDTEIHTVAVSPQVVLKNTIKDTVNNTLTLGFDYENVDEDILNDSLFFGTQTIGEFDLGKENYGYYIHDDIRANERLSISGGYRYDRAEFTFQPSNPDSSTMDEDLFTAGINYRFSQKSYVYISYSRSFRYPVLDEQFSFFMSTINTELNPQRADDYEVGVRYYFSETGYAQANLFRIDTDNEIFFNPSTFMNENVRGTIRRDGVEVSIYAEIFDWLSVSGSYTYFDAEIQDGMFKGNEVPNVPDHMAALGTVLSPVQGLTIALNSNYVGGRPFISDYANDFNDQEDYIVVNGKIQYTWKKITAFLDVNNILDEEYSEYGVLGTFPLERAFYPSPDRNVLAGLTVEF
jgi:iron complex outermembrane receptor protein